MPAPPPRLQLLVLLRHGAFCDERGLYLCSLAHQAAGAYEEALAFEMAAAAQASSSGYRRGGAASTLGTAASMVGLLGPATSLGLAGMGFPSLDSTRGAASVTESEVLAAAGEAAADHARAGCVAFLNLGPFMHLAPLTVRPETPAATGGLTEGGVEVEKGAWLCGGPFGALLQSRAACVCMAGGL